MLKETPKYIIYKKEMPSKRQSENDSLEYNNHMSHQGNAVKMRRRRYFPTKHGGICVNAVTGNRYPYTQGSFESLRLYQVVDASGKCDNNGYVRGRWDQPNKTSNFLYYDSPEQYARHQKVEISGKSSYQWHNDVKRMFPDDVFDKTAYLEIRMRKKGFGEAPVNESETVKPNEQANSDDDWN